jgi:hypothetical protein
MNAPKPEIDVNGHKYRIVRPKKGTDEWKAWRKVYMVSFRKIKRAEKDNEAKELTELREFKVQHSLLLPQSS